MAIALFKYKIFDNERDLHAFVTTGDPVAITAIVFNNSGKYVLFYT